MKRLTSVSSGTVCACLGLAIAACELRAAPARSNDAGAAPAERTDPSASQAAPSNPNWEQLCAESKKADFPVGDLPTVGDKAELRPGDSIRYYYGVAVEVDYTRARHAAFLEREQDNGAFTASTVLMMLYANGFGVERNLELAMHINCTIGEGESEIKARVLHLNSMRTMQKPLVFDFCDDVSGGLMEGHCAALDERRNEGDRSAEIARLSASWNVEQKAALDKLKTALADFASARARNERDLSAVDRGSVMTDEEGNQRQRFLESLRAFERGALPSYDAAQEAVADAALNRDYKEALKRKRIDTTVTAAGIKTTEKVWLRYRDAWVQFGAVRYPTVPPAAWKAWLTMQRSEQLRAL